MTPTVHVQPGPETTTLDDGAHAHVQRDFSGWIAATCEPDELRLGVEGFAYRDLFEPARLADLHAAWEREFRVSEPEAWAAFEAYRACKGEGMKPDAVSDALIAAAPSVSAFVAKLFGVGPEAAVRKAETESRRALWVFKREFVKKRVLKSSAGQAFAARSVDAGLAARAALVAVGAEASLLGGGSSDEESAVAAAVLRLFAIEDTGRKAAKAGGVSWTAALHKEASAVRAALAADPAIASALAVELAVVGSEPTDEDDLRVASIVLDAVEAWLAQRRADHADGAHRWPSLRAPHSAEPERLVRLRRPSESLPELCVGPEDELRPRDGFALTDRRAPAREIEHEIDYCLLCHDRDKDSCSKGLREPKTGTIKKNALGVTLNGCPLGERISEMHKVRGDGDALGALALVCIDNPMLPGTGHRICNDCMKACVFQKQEPVNIPQVETSVLTDVLALPWGLEIYGLLTRWNPLNVERPYARPYHGKNVLVVGLGPAGYTLSHHLAAEGFGVVAIDGLKIEPLPVELTGDEERSPRPVRDFSKLNQELDERILLGFGGVSEYGITVRWDKNFLTVLYVTLARQRLLKIHGGVRFGGAITLDDAWRYGFDHVAIAAGAGRPTIIKLKNNLARGIRQASDFLMALQLSGAYKRSSLANLQVRLPAVVIGGGLTAIDTATELIAYYPIQVEKTAERVATLIQERGDRAIVELFDDEERTFIAEQLGHAALVREERARAEEEGRTPDFSELIASWGGVSLVYRKRLVDSPAYRLNHEEVQKSLEEGVRYVENLAPTEAVLDAHDAVKAMKFTRQKLGAD